MATIKDMAKTAATYKKASKTVKRVGGTKAAIKIINKKTK